MTLFQTEPLKDYEVLIVGFSGGLDSTVLLHFLSSQPLLRTKIRAIHINHGLSRHADSWQKHCESLCDVWGIPLSVYSVKVEPKNVEEEARLRRYAIFSSHLPEKGCLLLGHHQDDVAETLLLHLMRGSGLKGLCSIPKKRPFSRGVLFRPLFDQSRAAIEAYAKQHALQWVEDESNQNRDFSRNYLRHEVLPLLEQRWPKAKQKMVQSTYYLQEAQSNLEALAEIDCPALREPSTILSYEHLMHLDASRLINIIRTWLHRLSASMPSAQICRRILTEVMGAPPEKAPLVVFGKYQIRRYNSCLYLVSSLRPRASSIALSWSHFPEPLRLSSQEILIASPASTGIYVPPGSTVEVRYRCGGETLRIKQHTHLLKKLFQEHRVAPWLRSEIPLVHVNNELVCAVDFLTRDPYDNASPPYIYHVERRLQDEIV